MQNSEYKETYDAQMEKKSQYYLYSRKYEDSSIRPGNVTG